MNEFLDKKILVCNSIKELIQFVEKYKDHKFCLYLAYKEKEDWNKSTSRVYMNQVLPDLIYLPINIEKEDLISIRELLRVAEYNKNIIAINITQPHKSNAVLRDWFKETDVPTNIDILIKDKHGKLIPYDINAPSFVGWFKDEVDLFSNKCVIVFGVGGVGEPIARKIIKEKPLQLILIDLIKKDYLAKELSSFGNVVYSAGLDQIECKENNIIFINCSGKEGGNNFNIEDFLMKYKDMNNIFVDLRPHLKIEIVQTAKKLGWKSYTGHGMNARNDYTLLLKIAELLDVTPMSFSKFKELVAKAS